MSQGVSEILFICTLTLNHLNYYLFSMLVIYKFIYYDFSSIASRTD